MTETTNQTAKYSKNYSGDVGETPKPMTGTWHLEAPDGRRWAGSGPLNCVAQEISERVPLQVQLARVLAIADEPDLDERHTKLGVEYDTVKVDELVDKLYAEIEALRAKLDALWQQEACGYLPYGYVGRSAMVFGQPVPESVPIYLAAGAQPAATRADGMPASKDERRLRRLLASRVNMPCTYWDDGEASGHEHGISIDFMRDSVESIDEKLMNLGAERLKMQLASAAGARPVEPVQKLRPDFIAGYDAGMADAKRIQAAGARPQEASYTSVQLAEMILSDCGCSTNDTSLLERVAKRIDRHSDTLPLPAPAAEPIDEYQRGRRAGITEFYDSLYAIDQDRARAALHKIEPQPAPAAQDDAKDAARWRYAVEIGGNQRMNWLDVYDDWDGDGSFADAIDAAMAADIFGDVPQPSQEPPPIKPMCCRCLDESDDLFPANCSEKPELLTGAPLGMYHCPDCGAMVCAGFPHGPLCQTCHDRKHPGFDCDNTSAADKKEPT